MSQFSAPSYTQAAAAPALAVKRRSMLRWAIASACALAALLTGLFTLSIIGFATGLVPFLIGLTVAIFPVPIYVTLVLWLDRYEPEPPLMLATAFFWGALVAVFFAIIINSLGVEVVLLLSSESIANFYGMVLSAPVVEETTKALALFALFFWRRDEFDGVTDGIVYAALIGLGFAMTENVKYYAEAVIAHNAVGVFIVRGLFSPFAHPLFTGMTGVGLGLAAQSDRRLTKFVAPAFGLLAAVMLHSCWNAAAFAAGQRDNGAYVLLIYFLVMVPLFIGMLLVVAFSLRREGRILREHLRRDFESGLIPHAEYQCLCSLRGRSAAVYGALARGGFAAWRARVRLNRVAGELAFHRCRVARGIKSRGVNDAEREATYMQQIYQLRRQLERK